MSTITPALVPTVIKRLIAGESIPPAELTAAFDLVMSGEATPVQIAALLVGLRVKGETADEVAAVARALRNAMVTLESTDPDGLVDTCGTGGGAVATFNISTAAALAAAGAGVRIAKHGNRSFTSQCGSADVLEALDVPIEVPVAQMERSLAEAGIVFMFAPLMHPAMRHVGPVRRELGIPTVMNMVGPLANPARAGRQVVGVSDQRRLELMAGALRSLGAVHALVVYGEPGMDEVSPLGPTRVIEIRDGAMSEWTIDPSKYGFDDVNPGDLAGGPPAENAAIVERVLTGNGPHGATAAVVLNAAAAIYVSGPARDFGEAVDIARAAVTSGVGLVALERLRAASRR
ncbi:MAG TPA: anthranilate phosphoribosyltransferase [Gemmatimonadaceae bacterium]|nr:anthranilate phosphoribosyltransferase [Gemmatimonadaceae bacterium]